MRHARVPLAVALVAGAAVRLGLVTPWPARAAAPAPLDALAFLIGEWEAEGGGAAGAGRGGFTFARGLQDRVIVRTNHAEYPASGEGPASRHDDLMVVHAAEGGEIRADYYDSEGHVIRYVVTTPRAGNVVFLSEAAGGAPRFRLTYTLADDGRLDGLFEIAPPGKPDAFATYLRWTSRRVAVRSVQPSSMILPRQVGRA